MAQTEVTGSLESLQLGMAVGVCGQAGSGVTLLCTHPSEGYLPGMVSSPFPVHAPALPPACSARTSP